MLLALTAGLGLTSCSEDAPWNGSDETGGIALSLESDGRVMRHGTRADDTMCPIVPDANSFGITLTNADGSYSKTWSNVDGFNHEKKFPIGDYTLAAEYGNKDNEGFELPYYYGSTDVHVSPGATTNSKITASLANAMVSIRYNETFTSNFPNYSAGVKTAGHEPVIFAQTESRPAFIDASGTEDVKLSITMTNKKGETVTVEPAQFQVQPRRHYVVNINATGNITTGDLVLDIEFEEEVVNETITLSLGDELFSSPAPSIKAKDFTDKEEMSIFEYENTGRNPQFDIFAFGGFKEVTLDLITAGTYAPTFGRTVQLVNAPEVSQAQLEQEGVKVAGLYANADKMAVVNIKDFVENLPAGEYTVRLQAKDAMTRLSEPVELTVKVTKVELQMKAAGNADYRAEEVTVDLGSNTDKIKDKLTFKVPNSANQMVDATVKNVVEVTGSDINLPHVYRYTLAIDPIVFASVDVKATYGKINREAIININAPEYTLETDAFAHFVVIKVSGKDNIVADVVENLKIYNGTAQVSPGNIKRDRENNFITVYGLQKATEYSALKGVLVSFDKPVASFTTEDENDVPNGNFAAADDARKLSYGNMQVGGTYQAGAITYKNIVDLNYAQPQGWASINDLTFNTGASPVNTWFVVPSSFLDNGAMTVRSVGYSHNGKVPGKTGSFFSTKYYNTDAPAESEFTKVAGEVFLGSYSNGKQKGIGFTTRPMSVSFDYKYTPLAGETGLMEIEVMDASGNVIASASQNLSATPNMKTMTVKVPSYPFGRKAAKLYVGFKSSGAATPSIHIPSGSELQEDQKLTLYDASTHKLSENDYHALATGSVLTLDNVKLGYDNVVTVTKAPRRNLKK